MVDLSIISDAENVESYVNNHQKLDVVSKDEGENRMFVVIKQNNPDLEEGVPLGSIGVTDSEYQVFLGRKKERGYVVDTYHSSFNSIDEAVDEVDDELSSMYIQS